MQSNVALAKKGLQALNDGSKVALINGKNLRVGRENLDEVLKQELSAAGVEWLSNKSENSESASE